MKIATSKTILLFENHYHLFYKNETHHFYTKNSMTSPWSFILRKFREIWKKSRDHYAFQFSIRFDLKIYLAANTLVLMQSLSILPSFFALFLPSLCFFNF